MRKLLLLFVGMMVAWAWAGAGSASAAKPPAASKPAAQKEKAGADKKPADKKAAEPTAEAGRDQAYAQSRKERNERVQRLRGKEVSSWQLLNR